MNKELVKNALHDLFDSYSFKPDKDVEIDLNHGYTIMISIIGLCLVIEQLNSILENCKREIDLDLTLKESESKVYTTIKVTINAHSYEELKAKLGYLKVII